MSANLTPATRAAELEKALVLTDQLDLILNAERVLGGQTELEVDAAEGHVSDLVTALQGLQASIRDQRVAL